MERRQITNSSMSEAVAYITEGKMTEINELQLDIAVKYCVEYAEEEALGLNNGERKNVFGDAADDLVLEDIDWKAVDAKQKEVKLKVLNWLVSEKKI